MFETDKKGASINKFNLSSISLAEGRRRSGVGEDKYPLNMDMDLLRKFEVNITNGTVLGKKAYIEINSMDDDMYTASICYKLNTNPMKIIVLYDCRVKAEDKVKAEENLKKQLTFQNEDGQIDVHPFVDSLKVNNN